MNQKQLDLLLEYINGKIRYEKLRSPYAADELALRLVAIIKELEENLS